LPLRRTTVRGKKEVGRTEMEKRFSRFGLLDKGQATAQSA
jgi:hypothetical protein